jgi:FSR family fosmidomycin resistance protein-like MFS transporter
MSSQTTEIGETLFESEHSHSRFQSFLHSLKLHHKKLLPLLGSHFSVDIYNSLFSIITPLLIQKFSLTLSFIGFLSALLSFTGSFLQPVYGYLSDKFHNRRIVLLAPVFLFLACCGFAFSNTIPLLVISLICLGTGFSLYHPKSTALVGMISKLHRPNFISLFVAAGSLGSAISPMFILLFVHRDIESLPNLFYCGFFAILAFICLSITHKKNITSNIAKAPFGFKQIASVLRNKNLCLLSAIVALRSATLLSLISFISPLYTDSWDQTLFMAGIAAFTLNIGGLMGGLCGGFIAERYNPRMSLMLSLFISIPFLWGFIAYKSLLLLLVGTFFSSWTNSICVSMSQQLVPNKLQSFASSFTMGFAWGIGALFIPFVGHFADLKGLPYSMSTLLPIPLFAASLLCLFLSKKHLPTLSGR